MEWSPAADNRWSQMVMKMQRVNESGGMRSECRSEMSSRQKWQVAQASTATVTIIGFLIPALFQATGSNPVPDSHIVALFVQMAGVWGFIAATIGYWVNKLRR
jgi:hypothetical protein